MASEPIVLLGEGRTEAGTRWCIGSQAGVLALRLGDGLFEAITGEDRDRFAEAVARAVTPGQVSDGG